MLDDEDLGGNNTQNLIIPPRKKSKAQREAELTQGFDKLGEVNIPKFTGEGGKSGAFDRDLYYPGTEKGKEYLKEVRGRITEAVESGDVEAVKGFIKGAKLKNNTKGVFEEAYRDVNLTSILERNYKSNQLANFLIEGTSNPLTKEYLNNAFSRETITEEEFLNSPNYREEMVYDKYITSHYQEDMAKRIDDRAREAESETFRTGSQKVGYFLASLGAGIVADPVTFVATLGLGSVSKSVGRAVGKAFVENSVLGLGLGYANKMEFKIEGVNKSNQEVLAEALLMGVGGGVIGGFGKVAGDKWSNFFNGKFLEKQFPDITLNQKQSILQKINRGEFDISKLKDDIKKGKQINLSEILDLEKSAKIIINTPNKINTNEDINFTNFIQPEVGLSNIDKRKLSLQYSLSAEDFNKVEQAISEGLITIKQVSDAVKQGISIDAIIVGANAKNINKASPNYNKLNQELKEDVLKLVNENIVTYKEIEGVSKALLSGVSMEKIKEQKLIKLSTNKRKSFPEATLKNSKIEFVRDALRNKYIENGDIKGLERLERDPAYLTSNQALNPNSVIIDLPTSIDISNYGMGFRRLNFNYKIVDYTEVLYSNRADGTINPYFNKDFQPRDRANDETGLAIIRNNARNIDPSKVILDFGSASSGAPLVKQDGTVIAGNGRMMSLELAYQLEKADTYKNTLKSMFPQTNLDEIKNPVLVREITDNLTDLQFIDLAKKSNIPEVDSLSSLERIAFDSSILDNPNISTLYRGKDLNSRENIPFYRAFFSEVAPNQLKTFIDPNTGELTIDGIAKIRNAILYSAYNKNDNFIRAVAIDSESEVAKTIISSFRDTAPKIFNVKGLVDAGQVPREFDISDNFSKAFNLIYPKDGNDISKINLSRLSYELNNDNFFGERLTDPITEAILRGLFRDEKTLDKLLTLKEMKTFFSNYWDIASKQFDIEALGVGKNRTPLEILTSAKGNEKVVYDVSPVELQINKAPENAVETKKAIDNAVKVGEEITQWQTQRQDTAKGYKTQTNAVKKDIEKLLNRLSEDEKLSLNLNEFEKAQYSTEANVLNLALYGQTAGEWRQDFPNLSNAGKNIRDISSINELAILDKMQTMNADLIAKEIPLEKRLLDLSDFAENERLKLSRDAPEGEYSISPFELENDYKGINNLFDEGVKKEYKKQIDDKFDLLKKLPDYLKCLNGK